MTRIPLARASRVRARASRRLATTLATTRTLAALPASALCQGDFVNDEIGQLAPPALASFRSGELSSEILMLCNTPNDGSSSTAHRRPAPS